VTGAKMAAMNVAVAIRNSKGRRIELATFSMTDFMA